MAYEAVISFEQTIIRLANSRNISIQPNSIEILQSVFAELISLQKLLQVWYMITNFRRSVLLETVTAFRSIKHHLPDRFPVEYQIMEFAYDVVVPFSLFVNEYFYDSEKKKKYVRNVGVKEVVHKLENVVASFVPKWKKSSLCLTPDLDLEGIKHEFNVFSEVVWKIKEEWCGEEEEIKGTQTIVQFSDECPKLYRLLKEIRDFADKALEAILRRLDRNTGSKGLHVLDGQIRVAVCELEDILEFHVSNHFLSQSDQNHPLSVSLDVPKLKQDIHSFIQVVTRLKEEYINELCNPSRDDKEEEVAPSEIDSFGGNKLTMIGLSEQFNEIKDYLLKHWNKQMCIAQLVGMPGIGKTTLAKQLYEDASISEWFEVRAWVRVGPNYELNKIMQCVLQQVNRDTEKALMDGDEKLAEHFGGSLNGRRYLIVLDDVDDKHIWDDMRNLLPQNRNGSRVLVTTRRGGVNTFMVVKTHTYKLPFLNKDESWDLLRDKVFGEDPCPLELMKVGKRIAENCDGLPLTIVMVATFLSKGPTTLDYWTKVAENESYIFSNVYNEMIKVLHPSYRSLPQHLKAFFLYMGVFPQRYEIPVSEVLKLWTAEGFLQGNPLETKKNSPVEVVEDLVYRSLLVVIERKSKIKTCRLHSSYWHMCKREAGNNKIFHVLDSRVNGLSKEIKNQRRLCVHNNVLFSIKEVNKMMASVWNARSLLCTGPHHRYPVPICPDLRLLRVMDALMIRFFEFPEVVLKLVQLRYLALSYNGKIPESISKLWNLQFLIIRRYLSINSPEVQLHLPTGIWNMKELKYIEVTGSNLRDPSGASLPNLLTLLDVGPHNCTKDVFEGLPNLEKLGIRIESPLDVFQPAFDCLGHISQLQRLESLKCVVVNPIISSEVVVPRARLSIYSTSLRKLSISGLGYPWEDMRVLASLPNLKVLKLRCYAFRGPIWDTHDEEFVSLSYLVIEDSDLVQWVAGSSCFPSLERISLQNCYNLEKLPGKFYYCLQTIELVDCNPLAVMSAKQIKENRNFLEHLHVNVHFSWDEEKPKRS